MLKHQLTHPELLRLLGQCGHGDRIAVVDSNYPATSRRNSSVPFLSLNITHGLVDTPTILRLIGQSLPIERITYARPDADIPAGIERPVHKSFLQTRNEVFPNADVEQVTPLDFYTLTSEVGLVVMIGTGERNHYGSAILTVGYLPELQ